MTLAVASVLLSAALAAQPPKATSVPSGTTTETTTIEVRKTEVKKTVEVATPAAGPLPIQKMLMVPVAPRKVADAVQVRNLAVNRSISQRYEQQFRGMLRGEYQFFLTVCEPTKPQRKQVARAGERALKDAAVKVAEWQQTPRRVVVKNGVVQQSDTPGMPDPAGIIRDALLDAAKSQLSQAQMDRYTKEIGLRTEFQKDVAIRSLVAKLDRTLFLSPEQREKIARALTDDKDSWWYGSTQFFAANDAYFPMVPDPCIVPVLSPAQTKVWQSLPRLQRSYWGGTLGPNTPLEDAELGEDGAAPE